MMTITDLPSELCLIILRYAAAPLFATGHRRHALLKQYSSALALCLVSKTFRLFVIPELLHTILLPSCKHALAFTHALQMQRAYAQEGSHLHVDYAARVHSIWMEECLLVGCRDSNSLYFRPVKSIQVDFSLLAPVVLASKSILVDDKLMFLLDGCLEYAWNACIHSNTHHKSSPLPWSVETLRVSQRNIASYRSASRATKRYSFLSSISHILIKEYLYPADSVGVEKTFRYKTPECSYDIPWACLKNLRFISFGDLHTHSSDVNRTCGGRMRIELLTIPDSMNLPLDRCAQQTSGTYSFNQDGRISSVDCCATVACTTCFAHDELSCLLCWRYKRR